MSQDNWKKYNIGFHLEKAVQLKKNTKQSGFIPKLFCFCNHGLNNDSIKI